MRSIRRLVFMLSFLIAIHLQAQVLTLTQVLEQSKQNYPSIKARIAEVGGADQLVKASATEYIPKLSLQQQYTYATNNNVAGAYYPNQGTAFVPSGGVSTNGNSTAIFGSFSTALVEWNVFNFGKISSNVRAARANLDIKQAAYENEIFQQEVQVADAYLLVLIAEKLTAIQQANHDRALAFWRVVQAGVRSGLRPGVDSSLAHAEFTKAKLLLLESQRNASQLQFKLLELSGTGQQSNALQIDSMKFYTSLPAASDSAGNDWKLNPVLKVYRASFNAAREKSLAVRRSFLPSISLIGAGWARGSGISNQDNSFHTDFKTGTNYQVYNYFLGVSTRWVLSDFFQVHHRYKSEDFNARRDEELYNVQTLSVQRQLKDAQMQYEVALEQARTAPDQLAAARAAYAQANARYKTGLTDLPTLLQSVLVLSRAEADLAVAHSNVWRSLLMIAAAKGDLSLFLNTLVN